MEEIKRIQDQMKRAFEGKAWHGPSVQEVLSAVRAEQAATKPVTNAHSIWEIVRHISAWKEAVRRRLEGEEANLPTDGDWPPVTDTSETAWQKTLQTLENRQQELLQTVARLTNAQLDRSTTGNQGTFYHTIHGIIQHDVYHAGQIALLKKV